MSISNQINNKEFISFTLDYIKSGVKNPIFYLQEKRKDWATQKILSNVDCLKDKFTDNESPFLKDVYLKFLISEQLQSNPDNKELKEWIVKDWGGIKTHKDFDSLDKAMELKSFDRISSWSKIASFQDIKNYIIYDSRVIYSLNWMLFRFNKETNSSMKYFFQPSGRNKLLTLLPVDAIINFDKIESFGIEKKGEKIFGDVYVTKADCYDYACCLIKEINIELFSDVIIESLPISSIEASKYPFFTEMLLFQMADEEIFNDIKKSISINISR